MYIGSDRLECMIDFVVNDCGNDDVLLLDTIDTSHVMLDRRFSRSCDRMLRREENRENVARARKISFRIALCVLLLLSAMFLTIMSVSATRQALWKVANEWTNSRMEIRFEPSVFLTDLTGKVVSGNALGTQPPRYVKQIRRPAELPDGWSEKVLSSGKAGFVADYYLNGYDICTYTQSTLDQFSMIFDSTDDTYSETTVNGYRAYVYTNREEKVICLVWNDGEYAYYIISYADLQQTVRLAESVE